MRFDAVLFDLDGTLVDSAPDLGGAANDLRARHGLPPLPLSDYRALCGSGARGMLRAGFGLAPGDAAYEALRDEFLAIYALRLLEQTSVFQGIDGLLAGIEGHPRPWGVVTNKAVRLAAPLLEGLALAPRAAVLVGGDTTPHTKPHPAPLLHAAQALGVPPSRCVYVGDDRRDMLAGRAAGMTTVAVAWGYLGPGESPADWNADHLADSPQALLNWLQLA
ncbi:MAG: HAD-IA family hydrolase [Rubrivivax sp.]|nr:HAD-IA family hydrolase [Rubrivivax sp.]